MLWLGAAAHAACPGSLTIAKVDDLDVPAGEAPPQRVGSDGTRATLAPYDWLCPGDRIEIAAHARVRLQLASGGQRLLTKDAPALPSAASLARAAPGVLELIGEVIDRLRGPRQPVALFNQARDPGRAQPTLRTDPLLPAGPQSLPPGTGRVALLWRGGPAIVAWQPVGAAPMQTSSGRRAYAIVDLAPLAATGELRLLDQGLAWPLRFDAAPPPTDPEHRLAQALQVLRVGPASLRLFALSELATLAAEGNFAAEQLWAAARSGELAAALDRP
jgi:hypothetical protein